MSTDSWFAPLTIETAPEKARPLIAGSTRTVGFLASPVARAAAAPPLLEHLLRGFGAFDQTSLSHVDREVIAMTVAYEHACHYCMALHTAMNSRTPELAPIIEALRAGTPLPDPRLEALRAFTLEVLHQRGRVAPATLQAFAAAGYTEQQALETILGVGVYVLSTFTNIATRAELDPPLAPHAWSRP